MFGKVEKLTAQEKVDYRRGGRVQRRQAVWSPTATLSHTHFEPALGLLTAFFPLHQVWTLSFMSRSPYPSSSFLWLPASSSSSGKLGRCLMVCKASHRARPRTSFSGVGNDEGKSLGKANGSGGRLREISSHSSRKNTRAVGGKGVIYLNWGLWWAALCNREN